MKLWGAMMILGGALYAFYLYRQGMHRVLRLERALVSDLLVLKNGICIYRKTLPSICATDLQNSAGAECVWMVMRKYLAEGDMPVQKCWDASIKNLPEMIMVRLAPLGELLSSGGESLSGAIDEVRRMLLEDIREQEQKLPVSTRLAAALCLSGACILIIMLA